MSSRYRDMSPAEKQRFKEQIRDIEKRYQAQTMPGAVKRGMPWSPEEDRLLMEMHDEHYKYVDMADLLQRSWGGVSARVNVMLEHRRHGTKPHYYLDNAQKHGWDAHRTPRTPYKNCAVCMGEDEHESWCTNQTSGSGES